MATDNRGLDHFRRGQLLPAVAGTTTTAGLGSFLRGKLLPVILIPPAGGGTTVTVPLATATGAALTPSVRVSVPSVVATATATALTPTQRVTANVPVASATIDAFAPTVTGAALSDETAFIGAASDAQLEIDTLSFYVPEDTIDGDLIVITVIGHAADDCAWLAPPEWFVVGEFLGTTASGCWAFIADGLGSLVSLTLSQPFDSIAAGVLAVFRAPSTMVLEQDAVSSAYESGASYDAVAPSVTTTQDTDLLIHSTATWEIAAISAPSGFEIGDGAAVISGRSVAIAHNLDAGVAGATGDITAFLSSPMSSYAYLLAAKLAPADAGALPVPLATATADAYPPTLLVAAKPPRALATAAALTPTLRVSVSVPLATATATALVPTVTVTGGVTAVTVPLATATADAFAPAVPMVVTPPRATATAAALAPRPTVSVVPPLATVQATAFVPAQVNPGVIVVLPPTATASAVAFVPFVRVYHRAVAHGSLVLAPALTATISLTMAMTTGTLTLIPAATGGIVAEAA